MKPDPRHTRIKQHLKEHPLKLVAWSGIVYRSTTLKHARSEQLTDGKGALTHAGRWNPPEKFRAVYFSLTPEASLAEVFQTANHYGIPSTSFRPRVIAGVQVQLKKIVDLRPDAKAISSVCSLKELLGEDWRNATDQGRMTLSQTLGSLLHASGIEGFLIPSAIGKGSDNLIIFNDNLHTDSHLEVLNAGELDENLKDSDH